MTENGRRAATAAAAPWASRSKPSLPARPHSWTRGACCCWTTWATSWAISGRSVWRSRPPRKMWLPTVKARAPSAVDAVAEVESECRRIGDTSTPRLAEIGPAT